MQEILHPILGPRKEVHDLEGRVAVVTGGALGIGLEISRLFALAKARVIMINRKEDQGKEAIEKIKAESNGDAQIEWIACDLSSLKEVKDVFTGIREREKRLDILVNSAGINANQFELDKDGIDRHFGLNWLGQFYATNLLYPLLRSTSKLPSTPAPRIVFESSELHRLAPSNVHFGSIEEINDPKLGPSELYARSKLAIILGVKYGLVEKVIKPNGDNIYALSVHPGTVRTDMQHQWKESYPGLTGELLTKLGLWTGRSPEQGSYSGVYAATSPEVEEKGWNGAYLTDPGQLGSDSTQARDGWLGAALWDLSHRLIKEKVGDDALADWQG